MIEVFYLHKKHTYNTNRGLAEKLVRKNFINKGYEVWKSNYLWFLGTEEEYFIYQRKKYEKLVNEIKKCVSVKKYVQLLLYIKANAGIPDFAVMKGEEFFFVEVKLNNESLKKNQRNTISFMNYLGLKTIIIRVSDNKRIYKKELNLETGKSRLKSHIPKLNKVWRK